MSVLAIVGLVHWFSSPASTETMLPKIVPSPTPDPSFEQFKGECKRYGLAYGDPSENVDDRIKEFGPANAQENFITIAFFDYAIVVHRKVAPCLLAVERDLRAQGTTYRVSEIGSYREEPREDRQYWYHAYGAAIDINPDQNPQCLEEREGVDREGRCASDKPYDLPDEWIKTFERYGFYWGGDYETNKDYMHFEWHGEKL